MKQQPKVLLGINYYSGKDNERAKYLKNFLKSIREKTKYKNYDLVIFDDASPHPPCDMVWHTFPNTREIEITGKPGVRWHRVRNRIHQYFLENPQYKYLMAFDEDYEVIVDNWMTHIVGCMENIPEIGILGSHWARLADGKTRQRQHTPTGLIDNGSGFVVHTNKFVTGGCWTLRREVVKLYPDEGDPDYVGYDGGVPGADTFYADRMMMETSYKLCTTLTDLVMHRGQEFMVGKFANKYNSQEFQSGQRLY